MNTTNQINTNSICLRVDLPESAPVFKSTSVVNINLATEKFTKTSLTLSTVDQDLNLSHPRGSCLSNSLIHAACAASIAVFISLQTVVALRLINKLTPLNLEQLPELGKLAVWVAGALGCVAVNISILLIASLYIRSSEKRKNKQKQSGV